jgi:hypothetical protein
MMKTVSIPHAISNRLKTFGGNGNDMESKPLNLKADPDAEPMVRLALQLFIDAAALKADTILLELDMGLQLKEQDEIKAIFHTKLKSVEEFEFKIR